MGKSLVSCFFETQCIMRLKSRKSMFSFLLSHWSSKCHVHQCYVFIRPILKPEWLGSRVVSVLDSGAEGPGFKSQPQRCRVTVLGKLFTPIVPLFTKQQKLVAALLRVMEVTAGLAESNGGLPPGLWLTSPARWQLRTGSAPKPYAR